jgi:hypothetical protein
MQRPRTAGCNYLRVQLAKNLFFAVFIPFKVHLQLIPVARFLSLRTAVVRFLALWFRIQPGEWYLSLVIVVCCQADTKYKQTHSQKRLSFKTNVTFIQVHMSAHAELSPSLRTKV